MARYIRLLGTLCALCGAARGALAVALERADTRIRLCAYGNDAQRRTAWTGIHLALVAGVLVGRAGRQL